jgi:hypothetical protein
VPTGMFFHIWTKIMDDKEKLAEHFKTISKKERKLLELKKQQEERQNKNQ